MKKILVLFCLLFLAFIPQSVYALDSFVSIVNPIRGHDFWQLKDQEPAQAVLGQKEILRKNNLNATWLIRYDALDDEEIISAVTENKGDEKGLFLEVTPSWAGRAGVTYNRGDSWHWAGSAFLTGYNPAERDKLIDESFAKFKAVFGFYPSSVGAWWIDSHSLGYMKDKYGITEVLIVADQYSTDNYQIWGQYFSTPYYPSKNNALFPARTLDDKLDVVTFQWASRDPVNSYGNGVMESTFSIQANDYTDYHNLDIGYFEKLLLVYSKQRHNQFSQIVVGLENSYEWKKYYREYQKQIELLKRKSDLGEIKILTLKDFSGWYREKFKSVSPPQIIVADDPLGSYKKAVWFMNPYYRAGWFLNEDGSVFRDIRQYVGGVEELCLRQRCDSVNFATSATRVLDEVSFGHKWIIDKGNLADFSVAKEGENYVVSYKNQGGNIRKITFLPRDIGIDSETFSIDTAILNATKEGNIKDKTSLFIPGSLNWSVFTIAFKTIKFMLFFLFAILVPGYLLSGRDKSLPYSFFISVVCGLVSFSLLYYLTGLFKANFFIYPYIVLAGFIFVKFSLKKLQNYLKENPVNLNLPLAAVVLAGSIFQIIPTFQSGLSFRYGTGFWGPNTHDGVWHIALINQLIKTVPPENPVFSGEILKNYHFFYDLMVAGTVYITSLPIADLIFRFYPLVFSLILGLGSYYLIKKLFEGKLGNRELNIASIFSLYLIYFAGSFGWIVEYLRERHFGGESAFWVNQAVSFNLNPPFALSLLLMLGAGLILSYGNFKKSALFALLLIAGTSMSFKSYTGILILGALLTVSFYRIFRFRDISLFLASLFAGVVAGGLFFANFQASKSLLVFAPFWFIHSMVDSPDRVGWVRLSLARTSSLALGQWPKFIFAEGLSLILFIVGNLGLRILSFGLILKIKEVFKNDGLLFIFFILIASMAIPVLFIQSGNPWNTIQFFYPSLYISALFAGPVFAYLLFKLPRVLVFTFALIILALAPINSFVTASGYLSNKPHAFISSKELEALDFLSKQPDGVLLTYPYDEKLRQKIIEPWPLLAYGSTAYVSAYSGKPVYLEDEPQNQILLTDYKKRLVASKDFFLKPLIDSKDFLKHNNITYIYLPKIFNARLEEKENIIKNIFENEETVIYRVI